MSATVTVTVCYGNHNKYDIDLASTTPVGKLTYYLTRILNKSHKEVLYIIINGLIVGTEALPLKREIGDCTVRNQCVAHIIFRNPTVNYPDADLFRNQQYQNYVAKQSQAAAQQSTRLIDLGSLDGLQNMFQAMGVDLSNLEDITVTIPESEYEQYITQVDTDEDCMCTICGQSIDDGVQLGCNHIFHNNCIRESLTTSSVRCPVCNYDVRD